MCHCRGCSGLGTIAPLGIMSSFHAGTVIGDHVRIDDFACIGKRPMKAAASAVTREEPLPGAKIGSGVMVGTSAIIYCGCIISDDVLIADLATIREKVSIGQRTIIGRGVSVECMTAIGARCKIETNAYITAYSDIGDDCFIAPGVVTSNDNFAGRSEKRFQCFKGVTVEQGGRIGAGAVVLPGKVIARDGFAAAGSVVTKDIAAADLVAGNPARVMKKVDPDQLLENQKK